MRFLVVGKWEKYGGLPITGEFTGMTDNSTEKQRIDKVFDTGARRAGVPQDAERMTGLTLIAGAGGFIGGQMVRDFAKNR